MQTKPVMPFPQFDRTNLRFGIRGPNQIDLFVVIREYWFGDEVVHAEVLASSRWPFIWFKLLRPAPMPPRQTPILLPHPGSSGMAVKETLGQAPEFQLQDVPFYKVEGLEVMRRQAEAQGFTLHFAQPDDGGAQTDTK